MPDTPSSDVLERVQRFVAAMENGGPQRVFYRDVDCPVSDFRELLATIERLSAELERKNEVLRQVASRANAALSDTKAG